MKRLFFYFIIPIVVIISFTFFMQPNTYNIVNAQTIENEIIRNTLEIVEKADSDIPEVTESLKNSSELIAMYTEKGTESIANPTQQAFKIEDIVNNLDTSKENTEDGTNSFELSTSETKKVQLY